jgi:peptide/nickel transport system substrate-binding protein
MTDSDLNSSYWARFATRTLNRRRALGAGAAGLTALGLAACGSSNNKSSNNSNSTSNTANSAAGTSTSSTTGAATPGAATRASGSPAAGGSPVAGAAQAGAATAPGFDPKQKTGGTIQYWMVVNPPLDPYENSTYSAQYVAGFAYSRLFKFNSGPDPKISLSRQPVGDLVSSYEVTPDGLTYTMKLQQNAMFHPPLNRPLTSADVMASWQRFTTDQKNTNSGVYAPIVDSLTAPDANTIVFKLKQPYAPFLNKLANPQYLWIMSQDAVAGKIDPSQQMVGTGPWIFGSKNATAITWKKNPNYFIKGLPYADGVNINIIPDTSTQEAQFAAGSLDILSVPVSDVDSMKKQVSKANVAQYTGNLLAFLFFTNVSDPNSAFKDPRMRQAASLALDRDGLLSLIYGGKGQWDNLINPGLGSWYLDPKGPDQGDSAKWFKHDPQQAKQLLQAAGHSSTQFKFIYPNNAYGDVYNQASDAVRGMLSDAGFQLSVVTVDYLKDYINNGQGIFFKGAPADSIVHALQTPFTDPDDYLFNMLSPKSMRNHESVNDADLNNVIQAQEVELDDAKRHQLVYQAQQMQDAQMYYPPTVNGSTFFFTQPWVQNYFVADDYGFGTESLMYVSLNK